MKPLARVLAAVRAWLAGAPGWVGGMLAGVQAALFSLAIILLPAWAVAASAPTEPGLGTDWGGASAAAARLWLLGFGVPWEIEGVTVSLPPLGVPALTALMIVALARRFADKTWTSWLLLVASFAGMVALVTTLAWAGEDDTSHRAFVAGVVAAAIASPSAAFGIWRAHGAELAWLSLLPASVRVGLRMGAAIVGAHIVLAAVAGAVWTVAGRHAIAEIATGLAPDAIGGVTLAALEALYVPTLVVWYMAWVVGVGFTLGLAHFAPAHLIEAPLPQVPLLGALPTASGGALVWMPFALVVAAAGIGLALRSRMPRGWARLGAGAVAIASVFAATAVLGSLAEGAVGPGTLATSGVDWGPFAGLAAALAAAGLLAAELVAAGGRFIGIGGVTAPSRARPGPPRPAATDSAD